MTARALGCGEKSVVHLFIGDRRGLDGAKGQASRGQSWTQSDRGIAPSTFSAQLVHEIDVSDTRQRSPGIIDDITATTMSLSPGSLSANRSSSAAASPLTGDWLRRVTDLVGKLQAVAMHKYTEGHHRVAVSSSGGHLERDGMLFGLGKHLSVQPLSIPMGQSLVPGCRIDGDGRL